MLALALVSVVHASPIQSLFNTGVDALGGVRPNGTADDLHYRLTSAPLGGEIMMTQLQIRTTEIFPIPPWVGADTLSAWIGPNSGSSLIGPPGDYIYETSFDLPAIYNPGSVNIVVHWAMDNSAIAVQLNGITTGDTISDPAVTGDPYTSFHTFTLNSNSGLGFQTGNNTLAFTVRNDPKYGDTPTGLRLEFASNVELVAPEPTSFLLFGAGLIGLSMLPRRRTRSAKTR